MSDRAGELHRSSIVIDGLGGTASAFDLQKAGGVTALNISLSYNEEHISEVMTMVSHYYDLIKINPNELLLVESAADIYQAKRDGKVGIIFGMQGISQIGRGLHWVQILHKLGLRICGLVYNESNLLGSSCAERVDSGLTYFGRQVVQEMNRHGMVVDLSHTGDRSSLDAIEVSGKPVILSHSNPRRLCPHPRNVPDELIKAVAQSGGVIGLSQYGPLLDNGRDLPTIATWAEHIDYVVNLVGIDHVGIGTDSFSGTNNWSWWKGYMIRYRDLVPARYLAPELEGVDTHNVQGFASNADMAKLTAELVARGYSDEAIQKVLGLNLLRVYSEVW